MCQPLVIHDDTWVITIDKAISSTGHVSIELIRDDSRMSPSERESWWIWRDLVKFYSVGSNKIEKKHLNSFQNWFPSNLIDFTLIYKKSTYWILWYWNESDWRTMAWMQSNTFCLPTVHLSATPLMASCLMSWFQIFLSCLIMVSISIKQYEHAVYAPIECLGCSHMCELLPGRLDLCLPPFVFWGWGSDWRGALEHYSCGQRQVGGWTLQRHWWHVQYMRG